ncbi:putative quinol monooxygenase [Actinomadura parmotrematis]|uniref:Antibiotic biosynthesis monooxygenase n=1 Tax=Actinomadura parmotrematis TaxID=2864039 RepID=A0ABS7FX88_9ACTN|nr:antibiotic biosynthesis monooxygenase family protein [Actinomadura parmotrematis]MBW8485027.1 antibiotic biosynthesis monooxygenase [Actinomadura parmotrematis]
MVEALLALLATLGALAATGLLVMRASKDRLLYLIAWSLTLVGISLALLCMTIGFLAGFNSALFRVLELGATLIAPLWLALGMIELIARYVQIRFAAWLFVVSYTVVALVIGVLDPVQASYKFTKALPKPSQVYDKLPTLLIDGAHLVAVIALVACTAVTAVLASRRDREAGELLIPVALVALAGAMIVGGTRGLLPGALAPILLGGAAGLVWYGAMRTIPVYEDGEDYDDEYREEGTGYDAPPAPPAPPERPKRGELRFPEPSAEDLLRPEGANAPVTTVDGFGPPAAAAAAGPVCGQITVYTLLDGREEAFDRLAGELVQAARTGEPDTLISAVHEVVNAPTQRILYELFRDEAAFAAHQRQPHVARFQADSRTHVLATNVIELRLGAAKVTPLPAPGGRSGQVSRR